MTEMEAIKNRHSVRRYLNRPIEAEVRKELDAFAEELNRESGLKLQIVYDDPAGFDAKLAHYGSFRNVNNYIVLKGKDCPDFEEGCGYYGEKLSIRAQMLGLNTCFAALTFNKKFVKKNVPEGERLSMVIALGYGESQGVPHKGKSAKDVVITDGPMPDWFKRGVASALLAPTAVNQQKFKIGYKNGEVFIRPSGIGFYTKVDLGIVKYHFEAASKVKVF